MKSVSGSDAVVAVEGGFSSVPWMPTSGSQSRLPSWSPGALYRGDDLPGVPLDCFTSSMIDDGSDPSWVPYEHSGLDPVVECSESLSGSDEDVDEMEVDQD